MAPTDGIVAYYKLDESSGGVIDATGNVADGTNSGAVAGQTGKLGTCYEFDDASDYITFDNGATASEALDLTGDFSICAWIYPHSTSPSTQNVVTKRLDVSNYQFEFRIQTDEISLLTTGGSEVSSTSPITANAWNFISMSRDADGNTVLYVNANAEKTFASKSCSHKNADVKLSMSYGNSNPFDGLIDGVGFWSRPLEADEWTALYNSGNGLDYPFSSGTTVSPSALTTSLTLNSPTITTDWTVSPSAFSLSFDAQGVNITTVKAISLSLSSNLSLVNPKIDTHKGEQFTPAGSIGTSTVRKNLWTFKSNTYGIGYTDMQKRNI